MLFGWFVAPFLRHDVGVPLGPDAPVYLWWTRLAGVEGLSAIPRPGVPALALALQGSLRLPLTAATAALEVAMAVAIGGACWVLARAGRADRTTSATAGLLGGTFAVHLASGYLATLAFGVAFIAGVAVLASRDGRRTIAASLLFAAGAMSHPLFAPLGLAILAGAAGLAWRPARDEVRRLASAALAAGAIVGVLLLALLAGPGPLQVDTSRDGFLRRAGMTDVLRAAYLDRFVHRWARYIQWVSVPLAMAGLTRPEGLARRVLWSWAGVTVLGVAVALATGLVPADRFLTFGFSLPILAAFGLSRATSAIRGRLARPAPDTASASGEPARWDAPRAFAAGASVLLVVWMLAGAWVAWSRQEPFVDEGELRAAAIAAREVGRTPEGTPIVVVVDERDDTASFLASRAANVVRAAVPPSRIRDVLVLVPPAGTASGVERSALTRVTRTDVRAAVDVAGPPLRLALAPFGDADGPARGFEPAGAGVWVDDPGSVRTGGGVPEHPLEASSAIGVALAAAGTLLLLGLSGYGWARAAGVRPIEAVALAPAFGAASLTLVAIALERAGTPLTGTLGPTLVSALALGGGYALRWILERRAFTDHPGEIE